MHPMNYAFMCKEPGPPNGLKVAVIGAGPSGLGAAGHLTCLGYEVHVYDKLAKAGGLISFGIPGFRVPVRRIDDATERLAKDYKVIYHLGTKVCGDDKACDLGDDFTCENVTLKSLVNDFDAVLIATGTWRSRKMNVPGEELPGVFSSLEFLFPFRACKVPDSKVPAPNLKGKRVAVVGGGHSAVDCVHSAVRNGASKVYLMYRRTMNEAPAGSHEIKLVQQRGVTWMDLTVPVRVVGQDRVEGLELQKCRLSEPDESGRRRPEPVECSEFVVDVDVVVAAIGDVPTPPETGDIDLGLDKVRHGDSNWDQMTAQEGVFIAGDVLTGPSKIGKALYSGLSAAKSIDHWLTVKGRSKSA